MLQGGRKGMLLILASGASIVNRHALHHLVSAKLALHSSQHVTPSPRVPAQLNSIHRLQMDQPAISDAMEAVAHLLAQHC